MLYFCKIFIRRLTPSELLWVETFIDRLLYDGSTEPKLVRFKQEQLSKEVSNSYKLFDHFKLY